jgi:hypothetical protein
MLEKTDFELRFIRAARKAFGKLNPKLLMILARIVRINIFTNESLKST